MAEVAQMDRLIGIKDVTDLTSLSRTTIWRLHKAGDFPKRIQITAQRVAWHESAVRAWIAHRASVPPI